MIEFSLNVEYSKDISNIKIIFNTNKYLENYFFLGLSSAEKTNVVMAQEQRLKYNKIQKYTELHGREHCEASRN